MKFAPRLLRGFSFVILAGILGSCASVRTQQAQYEETVPLVRAGRYEDAAVVIRKSKSSSYKSKDRVLYYLDLGMLLHWAGEYKASSRLLTRAEEAIEELYTKSISKGVSSAFLNDNALDYAGEDYEDVYLNVFKALNYIGLEDMEAAGVEIRRVQIKLDILEDKYKKVAEEYNASDDAQGELTPLQSRFHNDVLARYISLLLYRTEGYYDDARIDKEAIDEAWVTQSHLYNFTKPELPSIQMPRDGTALVNVLSFSGLGPVKLADTYILTSGAGVVFVGASGQDESYASDLLGFEALPVTGIEPGLHFKIQFPRLESRRSEADRIVLKLDGRPAAELPILEKMEDVARETFLIKQPIVAGRTIIRAVLKNVTKEIAKGALREGLADQGPVGLLVGLFAGVAADVAVDASENADLRISHFFPGRVNAAEFAVAPGEYRVSVEYWNGGNLLDEVDHGIRRFQADQLNLVESYLLR